MRGMRLGRQIACTGGNYNRLEGRCNSYNDHLKHLEDTGEGERDDGGVVDLPNGHFRLFRERRGAGSGEEAKRQDE